MFNDVDDEWKGVSFPTYFVISPADSTIVYQGVQFSAATAAALPLVTSTGICNEKQPVFEITVSNNSILARCVSANCESAKSLSLISLAGETIFNSPVQIASGLQATISLPENISPGIYLTVIYNENRVLHSKKTLIH